MTTKHSFQADHTTGCRISQFIISYFQCLLFGKSFQNNADN